MGCHSFGSSLRKPSKKKKHCDIWINSVLQMKRTRDFFRGGEDVLNPLSKPSSSRFHSGLSSSSSLKKGMISSQKNIKKSRPSNSRLQSGMVHRESNVEHSRSSSSGPDNVRAPPLKKAAKNAQVSSHKNKPSSLSLDKGRAPMPRNTKVSRPSLARPHNDMVSQLKDDEKSRPSRLGHESSSSKLARLDDSNSTFQIPTISQASLVVCNSSNVKQMPICYVQKEDQVVQNHQCNMGDNSYPKSVKGVSTHKMVEVSSICNSMELNAESTHGLQFNDDKSERTKPLSEVKLGASPSMKRTKPHDDSDSKEVYNCKPVKRRKYICEDDDDDGDQNLLGIEVGTHALTTTVVVKDRFIEVSNPLGLESFKVQEHSDLPIDEPIWSGDFKLGNKEYEALAAHLSAKHCDKVWKISKSLRPVVEVTKLSRLEAWPKSFEASRPTDESIALYFLPHEMRQNVDLDQLVKEITESDMVLRAVVEEAEMLIFPSILLPQRHQTFKGKPYLWAVFKRREDKVATPSLDEEHVTSCCARAEENHASPRKGHRVAGLKMGVEPEEVERQVTEEEQTPFARPKASRPAEGTACPTQTPTMHAAMRANHGHVSQGVSPGVSTGPLFCFIAGQTPRLEKLIKEMQSEGAVVFAMQGEMIGSGVGTGTTRA